MSVSANGKRISYEPAQSEDLTYYDEDRKARVVAALRPEGEVLTDGRFSPDGKWLAFHSRTRKTTAQVFIVPSMARFPCRDTMDCGHGRRQRGIGAAWSPKRDLLYFLSDRDGFRCIWAQRLNGAAKQPAGDVFAVTPFSPGAPLLAAHDWHHGC